MKLLLLTWIALFIAGCETKVQDRSPETRHMRKIPAEIECQRSARGPCVK